MVNEDQVYYGEQTSGKEIESERETESLLDSVTNCCCLRTRKELFCVLEIGFGFLCLRRINPFTKFKLNNLTFTLFTQFYLFIFFSCLALPLYYPLLLFLYIFFFISSASTFVFLLQVFLFFILSTYFKDKLFVLLSNTVY